MNWALAENLRPGPRIRQRGSTQLGYTHVAISKLLEVHRRTHPAATMKAPVKTEGTTTTADDLLDAIAKEDDD